MIASARAANAAWAAASAAWSTSRAAAATGEPRTSGDCAPAAHMASTLARPFATDPRRSWVLRTTARGTLDMMTTSRQRRRRAEAFGPVRPPCVPDPLVDSGRAFSDAGAKKDQIVWWAPGRGAVRAASDRPVGRRTTVGAASDLAVARRTTLGPVSDLAVDRRTTVEPVSDLAVDRRTTVEPVSDL